MEDATAHKLLSIQESFRNDPEYEQLWAEQEACNKHFLAIMDQLTQEQRSIIEDYIGILIEIQLRTLIYAVL